MKYLIKKFCTLIITLFFISLLSFLAFQVIPGDAALSKLGTGATEQKREKLRREMGLDRPVLEQYGIWLKNFGQGNMGESYTYSLPVSEMIREKMPANLAITAMSFLMMLAVSIPLGLLAGRYAGRIPDRILTVCNQFVMAVPGFFMGILITCVFGLALHWFTPGGYVSYQESWSGFFGYLIFPSIAIALPKCAMGVKLLRSSVIGELGLQPGKQSGAGIIEPCAEKFPASDSDFLGAGHCGYCGFKRDSGAGFYDSRAGNTFGAVHFQPGLSGSTGNYCFDCRAGGDHQFFGGSVIWNH